jgi:enolase
VVNLTGAAMPEDAFGFMANLLLQMAKPATISKLVGRQVLDSRGNPTVECDVYCNVLGKEKLIARASAPSGASTGSNEALELRDADAKTYRGKGVLKAVKNVSTIVTKAMAGLDPTNLKRADEIMCKVDGTPLKTNLGGNTICACSFAIAVAGAKIAEQELFRHFQQQFDATKKKFSLPRPMVNILNGGKHAGGDLRIQEFMIVPAKGNSFRKNLQIVTEVYHELGKLVVLKTKNKSAKNLGDEGGFAPPLQDPNQALTFIEEAIVLAGYTVGVDVFLALDCAASEFYDAKKQLYEIEKNKWITSDALVDYYVKMKKDHPALISIEDGFDEKDYAGWIKMTAAFAKLDKEESKESKSSEPFMIVGDDLYTTNTELIKRGVAEGWCNALLLKVNQIGTITEAMNAARMIFADGGNVAVSHRSGETTTTLIADLAVGIGAQFIKTGATARGERVCKYNRLLQIEEYLEQNNLLAPLNAAAAQQQESL